jgi:lipid-binding SYLF domain-containing protein
MRNLTLTKVIVLLLVCLFAPFSFAETVKQELPPQTGKKVGEGASKAITRFKSNQSIAPYFEQAYAYAIFPSVVRGGMFVGGAYGRGQVVEQGQLVGNTSFWQFMYGPLGGGEHYSQIIFFKNKKALDDYKKGNMEFLGQAGVAFVTLGAAATPAFNSGVAMFKFTRVGLLLEVTPSGAKYYYRPIKDEIVETASMDTTKTVGQK